MRVTDRVGVPRVMQFICWKLEGYDCSKLTYVRLVPFEGMRTVIGWVRFSRVLTQEKPIEYQNFRIYGAVNSSIDAYPSAFIHEVRKPDPSGASHTFQSFRGILRDKETAAVLVLSHEIAHFLMLTKQWPLRNCEGNANWIAFKWVDEYLGRKWSVEEVSAPRKRIDLYTDAPY